MAYELQRTQHKNSSFDLLRRRVYILLLSRSDFWDFIERLPPLCRRLVSKPCLATRAGALSVLPRGLLSDSEIQVLSAVSCKRGALVRFRRRGVEDTGIVSRFFACHYCIRCIDAQRSGRTFIEGARVRILQSGHYGHGRTGVIAGCGVHHWAVRLDDGRMTNVAGAFSVSPEPLGRNCDHFLGFFQGLLPTRLRSSFECPAELASDVKQHVNHPMRTRAEARSSATSARGPGGCTNAAFNAEPACLDDRGPKFCMSDTRIPTDTSVNSSEDAGISANIACSGLACDAVQDPLLRGDFALAALSIQSHDSEFVSRSDAALTMQARISMEAHESEWMCAPIADTTEVPDWEENSDWDVALSYPLPENSCGSGFAEKVDLSEHDADDSEEDVDKLVDEYGEWMDMLGHMQGPEL